MNKLQAYLTDNQIKRRDFAEKIGVHSISVWRFCRGKARPGLDTAVRIERETDGFVPVSSWVSDGGSDFIADHPSPDTGGVS